MDNKHSRKSLEVARLFGAEGLDGIHGGSAARRQIAGQEGGGDESGGYGGVS